MKQLIRLVPLALLSLMLSLNVADIRAGQQLTIVSAGNDFYCLFDVSCAVTPIETTSTFSVPGTTGAGILRTWTFAASAGSAAEGSYGYEYQLDLSNVDPAPTFNCSRTLSIKLGAPLATLDYNGDGITGDQVYIAPGIVGDKSFLTFATREGPFVTFDFLGNLVCPGDQTVRFGVLASGPPMSVLADLQTFEGVLQIGARAPNLAATASFKLTLLYDTIATLPPGGFIAPTLNAAEGRRHSMLNRVNAALALVEDDNVVPAVQHLQHLLVLTDGEGDDWVRDDPDTRVDDRLNLFEILQELIETLEDSRLAR